MVYLLKRKLINSEAVFLLFKKGKVKFKSIRGLLKLIPFAVEL